MKKLPLLFVIPMVALFIVIIVAVAIRLSSKDSTPPVSTGAEFPNPMTQAQAKPASFLGGLLGKNATPTPTPATAMDLSQELKNTADDGGAGELDALQKEAAGL